ncbi:MAG: hypothetical protein MK097_16960, partial [Dechloromonas sp.]|nr:hypothetical protein [Dechloromonas sp.]
ASLTLASAASSRITISDLLISNEKMTLAIRCLSEHDRMKSSARTDFSNARTRRNGNHGSWLKPAGDLIEISESGRHAPRQTAIGSDRVQLVECRSQQVL